METLLIQLPVLVFSVVLHEVAHGWVARREGDPTADLAGRLTLNPIPHIDPVGSILIPAMLALTSSGMMLGWARPVPVDPRNFRDYRRGDILVSLAGVAVNFLLAIAFTLVWVVVIWGSRLFPAWDPTWEAAATMVQYGVVINLGLMLFNLLPIPPLDGSHVMYHFLPPRLAIRYRQIGMGGMMILFLLLFLTGFSFLGWPLRMLIGGALHLRDLLV